MSVTELMIGDWVKPDTKAFPVVVIALPNFDEIVAAYEIDGECFKLSPLEISPVPIKEETLLSNGFSFLGVFCNYRLLCWDDGYNGVDSCDIRLYDDGQIRIHAENTMVPTQEIRKNITSIHELQHALREVGIEKEITL